jgi:hypothetical protein
MTQHYIFNAQTISDVTYREMSNVKSIMLGHTGHFCAVCIQSALVICFLQNGDKLGEDLGCVVLELGDGLQTVRILALVFNEKSLMLGELLEVPRTK